MHRAKFETFFQLTVLKNRTCSHSSNQFDEKNSMQILIAPEEKIKKKKVHMNELEMFLQ